MGEFVASLWWSFWGARWWVVALVLVLTLPIASLFVQLLSSPMSYLSGGTLKVMSFGWAVGIILCAVQRAFQSDESRQCEKSFFVNSLLAALPGALLIVISQKLNTISSMFNILMGDVVGYVPEVLLGFLGFLLGWIAATTARKPHADSRNVEPEPLRLAIDGKEATIHDLRQSRPDQYCTVIPHSDGRKASAHGAGGSLAVGHVLLVSRFNATAVYQIEHIRHRLDQPGKWHAQLRRLLKAVCVRCGSNFNPAEPCRVCANRKRIV